MVIYVAIAGTIVAVLALVAFPAGGVLLTLLVRPIIDATWAERFIGNFGLTDIIGVALPLAIFSFALFRAQGSQRFSRIPLLGVWVVYAIEVLLLSLIVLTNEGIEAAANVFFRQINGVAAYYMGQAFFCDENKSITFFRVLVIATLFPLAIGLYQFATDHQWKHADSEGLTRYIGLYHDAFTVRFYMLQGILSAVVLLALKKTRFDMEKALLTVFVLCALVVMFRAYSKSAVAAVVIWTLLWCVLRRRFGLLALAGLAGAVVAGVYLPEIIDQIAQMFHKEVGAIEGEVRLYRTFAGRWFGWEEMLVRWSDLSVMAKVFGSGFTAVGAHNGYLMMLMHGGVVGLAVYLLLIGTVGTLLVKNALVRPDPVAMAGLMAMALWCIDSIGLVPSAFPGYQWFIWAVVGLSLRTRADERSAKRKKLMTATKGASVETHGIAGSMGS